MPSDADVDPRALDTLARRIGLIIGPAGGDGENIDASPNADVAQAGVVVVASDAVDAQQTARTKRVASADPRLILVERGEDGLVEEFRKVRKRESRVASQLCELKEAHDDLAKQMDQMKKDHAGELLKIREDYEEQLAAAVVRHKGAFSHSSAVDDYKLWRKRNTGYASAESLCRILSQDDENTLCNVGSSTVLRAERRGGAAHHLAARNESAACKSSLVAKQATGCKTHSLTIIRTDAFSSATSNTDSHKMQVTEVKICGSDHSTRRFVADLQDVNNANAKEFRSVIIVQLQSLGVDTWLDDFPATHFAVFLFVADDGPEIGAGVNIIREEIKHLPNVAVGRYVCFFHSLHNCQKKSINDLDELAKQRGDPIYSNMIIRVSNVWRSFGHHAKLKETSLALYDPAVTSIHFTTCIGKIIRTRWGSFDGPERKLLRGMFGVGPSLRSYGSWDEIVPPFLAATADARPWKPKRVQKVLAICDDEAAIGNGDAGLPPEAKTVDWATIFQCGLKVKAGAAATVVSMDIDGENAAAVMRARAGRAHRDLKGKVMWIYMMLSQIGRWPYSRALYALQKVKGQDRYGNAEETYFKKALSLLRSMEKEFKCLGSNAAFADDGYWAKIMTFASDDPDASSNAMTSKEVSRLIREVVSANRTELLRRFGDWGIGKSRSTPAAKYAIFHYLYADGPDERIAMVSHMLSIELAAETQQCFMGKLISFFREELTAAAADQHGNMCPGDPLLLFTAIDREVECDVQGVESMNSILRLITTRSRRIKRDLVNARHVILQSDKELVTRETYTTEMMKDANQIAIMGTDHHRFIVPRPPPEIAAMVPPRQKYSLRAEARRVPTACRLAVLTKPFLERYDIAFFCIESIAPGMGDDATPTISKKVGPWYFTSSYRKGKWGLECHATFVDNIELGTDIPALVAIGDTERSLFDCMQELVAALQWPPPQEPGSATAFFQPLVSSSPTLLLSFYISRLHCPRGGVGRQVGTLRSTVGSEGAWDGAVD